MHGFDGIGFKAVGIVFQALVGARETKKKQRAQKDFKEK
jgi:hypothetical protein